MASIGRLPDARRRLTGRVGRTAFSKASSAQVAKPYRLSPTTGSMVAKPMLLVAEAHEMLDGDVDAVLDVDVDEAQLGVV